MRVDSVALKIQEMEYLRNGERTFRHLTLAEKSQQKTCRTPKLDLHCCACLKLPKATL